MKRLSCILTALLIALAPAVSAFGATYVPTTTKQEILKGDIQDGHSYKVAFYTATATCDATFAAYTATNEVGTAGGYAIGSTGYTTGVSGTTAYIDDFTEESANVVTLSSATFGSPAACGIVYDDTHASDQVLFAFDISPTIQPSAEDVTLTLPTDDASNAIIRIQ